MTIGFVCDHVRVGVIRLVRRMCVALRCGVSVRSAVCVGIGVRVAMTVVTHGLPYLGHLV